MEFRGHDNVIEIVVFAPVVSHPAIREMAGITGVMREDKTKASANFIATGSRDKLIKIWDGHSGQCLKTLSGHDNWVRALVFHPNGKFLLSAADDKTIKIWDLKTGRCAKTIEAHDHFVTSMAWGRTTVTPTNTNGETGKDSEGRQVNVIATGSVDQKVKIWLP